MKFQNKKLVAILFLILIAGTFASNLSLSKRRTNRSGRKSLKITKRVKAKSRMLDYQSLSAKIDAIWDATTSCEIKFTMNVANMVALSLTGTLDKSTKSADREFDWVPSIEKTAKNADYYVQAITKYILQQVGAMLTKYLIATVAPWLGVVFFVFEVLEIVGTVLEVVNAIVEPTKNNAKDLQKYEIKAEFKYPIFGVTGDDSELEFSVKFNKVEADPDEDEDKDFSALLFLEGSFKMEFDKKLADLTVLGGLLSTDAAADCKKDGNGAWCLARDIIGGVHKVVKAINSFIDKAKKFVIDVCATIVLGLLHVLAVALFGKEAVDAAVKVARKLFRRIQGIIFKVLGAVTKGVGEVCKALGLDKFLKRVAGAVFTLVKGAVMCVAEIGYGVYSAIKEAADAYTKDGALAAFTAFAVTFASAVWAGASALLKSIGTALLAIGKGVVEVVKTVGNTVKKAWGWFKGLFKLMRQALRMRLQRKRLLNKKFKKYSVRKSSRR